MQFVKFFFKIGNFFLPFDYFQKGIEIIHYIIDRIKILCYTIMTIIICSEKLRIGGLLWQKRKH